MSVENPKLTAYLNVVKAAQEQHFGQTSAGLILRGLMARLVWVKIQAEETGLSEAEVEAAIQIGEHRNPLKAHPPLDTNDYAPGNSESYWRAIYDEANHTWERQDRDEDE